MVEVMADASDQHRKLVKVSEDTMCEFIYSIVSLVLPQYQV